MARLCLIGNSHLASMKFAWEELAASHPTVDIHYSANSAVTLAEQEITLGGDGRIFAGDEAFLEWHAAARGSDKHDLVIGKFDAIVLIGMAFSAACALRPYHRYQFSGLKRNDGQVISRDHYKRAAAVHAAATAGWRLAQLLKGKTRLFFVPCPLPSEQGYLDLEKNYMEVWRQAAAAGDSAALMGVFDSLCADLTAEGATVVPQPADTQTTPAATLQRFNKNVLMTKAGNIRPSDDYLHMNKDYAALVWRDVLAAIGAK